MYNYTIKSLTTDRLPPAIQKHGILEKDSSERTILKKGNSGKGNSEKGQF